MRSSRTGVGSLATGVDYGRNLGGTVPRAGAPLEVYAQFKGSGRHGRVAACKIVGLAYVGSNPTPATSDYP
jgi:hypothetical protein